MKTSKIVTGFLILIPYGFFNKTKSLEREAIKRSMKVKDMDC